MIVQCPSCSTGYHLAQPPPPAVLRCSRCNHLVPPPSGRRSYALASSRSVPVPRTAVAEPRLPQLPPPPVAFPAADLAPLPPSPVPEMHALDAALFAPPVAKVPPPRGSARTRTRPTPTEPEPAGASALVPLGLAALGAAGAWFAAPRLTAWISPLPFAPEPWMLAAAGAASGLLLGGVWLGWRAARR